MLFLLLRYYRKSLGKHWIFSKFIVKQLDMNNLYAKHSSYIYLHFLGVTEKTEILLGFPSVGFLSIW